MSNEIFTTQEVGSLSKPDWRIKAIAGNSILKPDIDEAVRWGHRLQLDPDPLVSLLSLGQNSKLSPNQKEQVRHWASVYAVRLQEQAGLSVIYDGEQNRVEMYKHAARRSNGLEPRGEVRSWDNKYSAKFAAAGDLSVATPWHVDELLAIQKITQKPIKVPITGAYTIAAWSFNEFFASRQEFILSIARNLIRPNIEALIAAGAKWIQIDEPAATTVPDEVPLFVEAFNESIKGLAGKFSVHVCFSDYNLLFPHITKMENCSQYSLEFANRDSHALGVNSADRPAYEVLKKFKDYAIPSGIGLGVVDVHNDNLESPELVRDRILYATQIMGDPKLINPSPDCGLRTRNWDIAYAKLQAVVEGTRLAEKILS